MTDRRGAYTADRAAALSGVPWSTVHEWARKGVIVPSVSPTRIKLWSYTDLLSLRFVCWLRHPKPQSDGPEFPAISMREVKRVLNVLANLDLDPWRDAKAVVRVDRAGKVYVGARGESMIASGQLHAEVLDPLTPFESEQGIVGPDLVRPRPHLRIIPGKLAGAPHVERTRLETEALGALAKRGVSAQGIYRLYPNFDRAGITDAIDLEAQLARNLEPRETVAA
jgi:uncharacterized protein (DUF433 family)